MWDAVKVTLCLIIMAGLVLAVCMTGFVLGWAFKIIGFVLAVVGVIAFFSYCVIEGFIDWWENRK